MDEKVNEVVFLTNKKNEWDRVETTLRVQKEKMILKNSLSTPGHYL